MKTPASEGLAGFDKAIRVFQILCATAPIAYGLRIFVGAYLAERKMGHNPYIRPRRLTYTAVMR